ncbi:MAG: AAA family ATPase [Alphaproteobacteria bacterium]|jgi:predicted AAA+ superfamily ATPase|nr:AAA family ATPase [Alphaproteobacteria bacterium]
MLPIGAHDIKARLARDNPWWSRADMVLPEDRLPRRVYFAPFQALAMNRSLRRAPILLGPRRVGKTVMVKQLIAEAIAGGMSATAILYASIDTPVYSGMSLEQFIGYMPDEGEGEKLIVFDEIQYLKDWEQHLKDLVDSYANIKFVATGSAAAALRLKSRQSGAGRFTDFMLPPLTFYEFLFFIGEDEALIRREQDDYTVTDIDRLNRLFVDYLNFGGYPEAVLNNEIRNSADQFIRNDIIDKVLLKDLPSLYGISQIQEMNRLFSFLAYNAGHEATLENISTESGVSKPTITRYIEYLESAFLIMKVPTVDENCRTLKRQRNFKVYLNNPSMRAALFAPVDFEDRTTIGHLTESAIFAQWQHSPGFRQLRYARWKNEGEVDVVYLNGGSERPLWVGEIKWSDRIDRDRWKETESLAKLLRKHASIESAFFTSRTARFSIEREGRPVRVIPSALYCYIVGRNITSRLEDIADPHFAAEA